MPLQFWCFGTLPLQFVYLDICHCNSVFISIIPFSTLGLTMGLRKDKNALIFTVCVLCGRRTGPATVTQRLRQPRGTTTGVPMRAAVARAALAGLAMAGGGARLQQGAAGAAARVACEGGGGAGAATGVLRRRRRRRQTAARRCYPCGEQCGDYGPRRAGEAGLRAGDAVRPGERERRALSPSTRIRRVGGGAGACCGGAAMVVRGRRGAAHMACGGAGAVTGSCRGGAHGLGGLRRHGGCGGKLGRRRHGGCGRRLRGRR
ncbi:hypothetical protein GUJ93_ZPchr0012g19653 [Zizania palustris]|uniref:Uncharacterized protein n=1 Tax=Zizania palustris TaxID=103762 RepID=A0A8J5WPT8_ZIZPA|nr:hypothetical protein GUJ93_ZPchr0012g19653 [Zizania palustris]